MIPGEVALAEIPVDRAVVIERTHPVIVPSPAELEKAAQLLNVANKVTILAGAGVEGAHDDVGMTGLLGLASGYRAMESADALLVLGSDFPYPQFYPAAAATIQVDIRGSQLGMNGRRRLIGSFSHGSMANALLHGIGAQTAQPDRQVVALAGDGGLTMMLGELITLTQNRLQVKTIVVNNSSLNFVELEMKAAGFVTYATDLENPNFAAVAEALGIFARLYAIRTVLSGRGDELLDLARANWRQLF